MLAVLEHIDGMSSVIRRVRGQKHGLDLVIFDKFLERRIGLAATAGLGQSVATLGNQIADRHHFHVGMVLEVEGGGELAHVSGAD